MHSEKLAHLITSAMERRPTLALKNARIVNVFSQEVIQGDIAICDDTLIGIGSYHAPREIDLKGAYVCPGFIDAHVHIESTMAHPARFAQAVLPHGTTTVVADPHELANVCGIPGIQYLLEQTEGLPLQVYMMAPSCVPCTGFESSGATLLAKDLKSLLSHPRVLGLGEVMDYTAVSQAEPNRLDKLSLFAGRPIDGHAPLVSGDALNAYCIAGPMTDHECSNYEEILEKLRCGLRIQLRMGSAAHGIESIFRRIAWEELPTDRMMFCTDDKHLEDTRRDGHINYILRRAVAAGIGPIQAIRMATLNPAQAYGLRDRGAIAPGCRADLVVLPNLREFKPEMVFVAGQPYEDCSLSIEKVTGNMASSVRLAPRTPGCLDLQAKGLMPVIELVPAQLVTKLAYREVPVDAQGIFQPGWGLNKLAVLERHHATGRIGLGILSGLGIQQGAIASTVAHDSHNLVVAGDNDRDIRLAIDALEGCGGGYVVVNQGQVKALLPLPIGGLMTELPLDALLAAQQSLLQAAAELEVSHGSDPFITLSFLALPVIPYVRLTDLGVFDVLQQRFIR